MASDNVQVVVRVRPLITREKIDGAKVLWQTQNDVLSQKDGSHQYRFDQIFSQNHTTDDVYDYILPIVKSSMDGINGTVFAYGQTASGKTYTMTGDMANPGIIPQTVEEVFNTIENSPDREFLIRFSFMEIYNENVVDLLGDLRKHLEVREDTKSNIFVDGLNEEIVTGPEQVLKLLASGENKRHYGSTNMNERSSRSHTIFKLIIESRQQLDNTRSSIESGDGDGAVKVSTLNLVDLAGSEKAKHTGATGQRLAEGGFINKSLLHLSSVISQLSENASFISYRDSRLTRILQNSLGGNSKTAIICNVTPAAIEETLSTLRFATSAKRIKNKPKVNEVLSDDAMLKRYKKEIAALKKTLKEMKQTDVGVVQEEKMELEMKLEEEKKSRQEQESRINKLTELICVSSQRTGQTPKVENKRKRRETWCPGKGRKSMAAGLVSQANQRWEIPSFSAARPPIMPLQRRRQEDKELSFNVMSGSLLEESDGFQEEVEGFDRLHKPINFEDSSFVQSNPCVCDADCQTEQHEVGANDDNVDLLLQIEAFKLDLESRDTKITDLCHQLEDKEEALQMLTDAVDKQMEKEDELNGEIYRLQVQLRERERQSPGVGEQADRQTLAETHAQEQREAAEMIAELTERLELHEAEKLELQRNVSEACSISQGTMIDLEAATQSLEELKTKNKILECELEEQCRIHERDLEDLSEFRSLEEDYSNMSMLEKQEARRRLSSQLMSPERASDGELTRLQKKVAELEKDCRDTESLCLLTKKQLAQAQDETKLLDQEYRNVKGTVYKLEKTIERLENEKQDFDLVMEMEVNKYKRRESELTEQLSSAYSELGSGGTPVPDKTKEREETEAKVDQLQQQIHRLEDVNTGISEECQSLRERLESTNELQELEASQGVCHQCGKKVADGPVSSIELNQTADCSTLENQMMLLRGKPTMDGDLSRCKQSVFDEMADMTDLTVGLTGMFPQRALQDTTTTGLSDLELEAAAAMTELKQDLELQLQQCKEELSEAREREGNMAEMKERLESEKEALAERCEGLVNEIEGLRAELRELVADHRGVDKDTGEEDGEDRVSEAVGSESVTEEGTNRGNNNEEIEGTEDQAEVMDVTTQEVDKADKREGEWEEEKVGLLEECEALRRQAEEIEREKQALKDRIVELEQSVCDLEQKLQSQPENEENAESADFDRRIAEIRDLAMEKLEEAKSLYKSEQDRVVNQMSAGHKKEMEELQAEQRSELERLQAGHQQVVQELKAEYTSQTGDKAGGGDHNSQLADQIIDKQRKEISNLQEELSVAENVMVMKESELEALEQKYTETVQRLTDERHQLQADMAQRHKESMEHLKEKHRQESEEMNEQLNSLCEKYNEILDSQDEQGRDRMEVERLEARLKAQEADSLSEREELSGRLEDCEHKLRELSRENGELQLKYDQDTQVLAGEMNTFRQDKQAQLEICNTKITELEAQLTELKQGVKSATAMLEEKREELEISLQEKEQELQEKEQLIGEGRATLARLTGELEGAREALRESEADHRQRIEELEAEKCRLKLENERCTDEIQQLNSKVSDTYCVNEEVDQLKQSLQEVREEREVLSGKQKVSSTEIERLTALVSETEGVLEGERKAVSEAQDKIDVLESTISKGYAMMQQYEQDTAELEDECDKMREEKEQLEQKYEDLMDKYDHHLEEVRSDHEADIQTYVDRNAELQAKYEAACLECDQVRAEAERSSQEDGEVYLAQIAGLEQEVSELGSKHAEEEVRLKQQHLLEQQQLEDRLRDLEMEQSGLQRKLESLEVQRQNDLMEQEAKLQKDIRDKEEALDCVQKERCQLKQEVEECKQTLTQLKTEVAEGLKALKSKEEEVVRLRRELKESEEFHEEEEERLKGLIDDADGELEQSRRDYIRTEREFDDFKKKHLNETSMSFTNAEEKYQKQLEKLKWQYEQEIARLRRARSEANTDLNASVCQLKEEKHRMGSLQEAGMRKERENEALRTSLHKANGKLEELQKELKEVEEAAEEEADHLKSCVDSAEDDLDKKTSECYRLQDEIKRLNKALASQEGAEKLVTVEKERDEFRRQVGQKKLELVLINTQMMKVADPLKREIKYLKGDNSSLRDQIQKFKNEVRRLKNNQQDDSVVCDRPQSAQVASNGVMSEVLRFNLETEKKVLERENEQLKRSSEASKGTIVQLREQLSEKDSKLAKYKKYYKKQLTAEEKTTLQDIVNSPRPEATKFGRLGSRMGGENRSPGSENWDNMSWMVKNPTAAASTTFSTGQDDPDGCKQQ